MLVSDSGVSSAPYSERVRSYEEERTSPKLPELAELPN